MYKHGPEKELWSSATFEIGVSDTDVSVPQRTLPCSQMVVWVDFSLGTLTGLDVWLQASSDGGQNWRQVYDAQKTAMGIQFTASFPGAWHLLSSEQAQSRHVTPVIPGSLWRLRAEASGSASTTGTLTLRSRMYEGRRWGI